MRQHRAAFPSRRRWLALLTAIGVIGAALWLLGRQLPGQHASGPAGARQLTASADQWAAVYGTSPTAGSGPPPKVGAAAPDFRLRGLDDVPLSLGQFRGQTVVLTFWATWCAPCRVEFPAFEAAYQRYAAQGLVVLAVDVGEGRDEVRQFLQQVGATFPTVIDSDSAVVQRYRLLGLPTTFIIDTTGAIRAQQLGPLTTASLTKKLRQAGLVTAGRP